MSLKKLTKLPVLWPEIIPKARVNATNRPRSIHVIDANL